MTIQAQNLLNANISRLSALRYGDAKTLPAADVHIRGGFDALPRALLAGLPPVEYGAVVTHISQAPPAAAPGGGGGGGVTLQLANGSSVAADYAILTTSLGCLKAGAVTFDPPLPADKQAAIRDMGMGVLDKLVLVFDRRQVFWANDTDFVILASPDWSGRWSVYLSYWRLLGLPVLVGLNAADTALDLEARSDAEVVAEGLQALSRAFGRNASTNSTDTSSTATSLPRPVEAHVTRWGQDPYARGSYSYYATGNPRNITDVLAAPHGRVLFAGEATSSKMATALGALLSGQREAARLLNWTKSGGTAGMRDAA